MSTIDQQLLETLKSKFGFNNFRPNQLEAIKCLMQEGSALCIHPTGFGKSLLYQLPAMLLEGITVVISPLLALMRDQEKQLNKRFGIPAAAINSDQSEEENNTVRDLLFQDMIKILFVSPEQLENIDRFEYLLSLPIELIVVDEAHCISTWGHDFRPGYRQIIRFVQALQNKKNDIKILGLTATANERTEIDIKQQLSLSCRPIKVMRQSMDRANISLSVLRVESSAKKLIACEQIIRQIDGCGIIYCATRDNVECVSKYLQTCGINSGAYHAGFLPPEKLQMQQDFLEDKFKVLAATNALGMGIDKSNLRYIIHYDIPGSITAYYQEIGRCGRDGLSSQAILIYDPDDKRIQRHFIESSQPKIEDFEKVLHAVATSVGDPNLSTIKELSGLHPTKVIVILAELIEQNILKKVMSRGTQVYVKTPEFHSPNLIRYETQLAVKSRELESILHYAEQNSSCRMEILRQALGDQSTSSCMSCSTCTLTSLKYEDDPVKTVAVTSWLADQGVSIPPSKTLKTSIGLALLDGRLRTPPFIDFMRGRTTVSSDPLGIPEEVLIRLKNHLALIASKNRVSAVIAIPSRTWAARTVLTEFLGKALDAPVFTNLLFWKHLPNNRQGELMNNDQRYQNVRYQMAANFQPKIGPGPIILFDDYFGSGNTIKEAGRVLRKDVCLNNEIIPFTIAFVKWKLGSPGMI